MNRLAKMPNSAFFDGQYFRIIIFFFIFDFFECIQMGALQFYPEREEDPWNIRLIIIGSFV